MRRLPFLPFAALLAAGLISFAPAARAQVTCRTTNCADAAAPQLDLDRLEAAAATVRELPFRAPVEKLFVSREQALPLLAEQVDEDLPGGAIATEQRLLAELELLPV